MSKLLIVRLAYLFPPLFVFLSVFVTDPFWSLKTYNATLPLFELIYVLFSFVVLVSCKTIMDLKVQPINLVIIIFLSYGALISYQEPTTIASYILLGFFSYSFAMKDHVHDYDRLLFFLFSYICISVIVYIIRGYIYDFDFYKLRGNISIWGGNSLLMVIYLFITIQAIINREPKEILLLTLVAAMISLMFMSRIFVVTSLFLLLFQIKYLLKSRLALTLILIGIVSIYFSSLDFLYKLLLRFDGFIITNSFTEFIQATSSGRLIIWDKAYAIIQSNPMGIGIGMFGKVSGTGYTSAHNLLLNNIVELGILFGGILNLLLLLPIYKIIKLNIPLFNKFIALLAYSSFLINSIISGGKFIQTSGYISSFTLVFVFSVFNMLKHRYKINTRLVKRVSSE